MADDYRPNPAKMIELQPEEVAFDCYECGAPCKLFPRHTPMAAVHAATDERGRELPPCKAWQWSQKEKKLAAFLKRCGLPVGYEGDGENAPS
jgi:hypothetical protein